jgi:hypothetical protein
VTALDTIGYLGYINSEATPSLEGGDNQKGRHLMTSVLSSGTKFTSKPEMQRLLTRLRKAGYDVSKSESGIYRATAGDRAILTALPGTRGYMFSYDLEAIN